jgi:TIR domain
MVERIFISYRRDDDPNGAARVRDALAAKFGTANVFMDVDNLVAGQRFDEELAKALAQCDVLIAVVGARWMELLKARSASGENDYVRQEIAEALRRKLLVIPVRVGREGSMPPLPRVKELPPDIRDVVFYQKLDLAHERFGRDIEELANAITAIRNKNGLQHARSHLPWGRIGAAVLSVLVVGYAGAYYADVSRLWMSSEPTASSSSKPRAEHKREHRFDGDWEVTGMMDNCPTAAESTWTWKSPLQITDSKVISAGRRGKTGASTAEGHVLENGEFRFAAQGLERVGTYAGAFRGDSGRGTYTFPSCSGPRRDECCSGTLTLSRMGQQASRPSRGYFFDGRWEVNGLNGASCPKPGLKWKPLELEISDSQINVDGSVVGRVLENGSFEFTRPLPQRPTVTRTVIGILQTGSGRGTFGYNVGACRGTVSLKRL